MFDILLYIIVCYCRILPIAIYVDLLLAAITYCYLLLPVITCCYLYLPISIHYSLLFYIVLSKSNEMQSPEPRRCAQVPLCPPAKKKKKRV